ncbi:unnamed protein product [Ascophyllum nodosum]
MKWSTMSSLAMLVLLLALVGLDGFVVIPVPRTVGVRTQQPRSTVPRRGPPGFRKASPQNSPDSMDEVRQRLISSSEYGKMVNRLAGKNPFGDEGAAGVPEQEAEEPRALRLFWSTVRFAVDVGIVLFGVVLCVNSGKLPANLLAPFDSVATAIKGSPIEQVLEALPWERAFVLRSMAEVLVALILSPLADRLIVAPAIQLWVQIRSRSPSP